MKQNFELKAIYFMGDYPEFFVNESYAGKTYYVKLRTYKTIDGTKKYSAWSEVQKVKTK